MIPSSCLLFQEVFEFLEMNVIDYLKIDFFMSWQNFLT